MAGKDEAVRGLGQDKEAEGWPNPREKLSPNIKVELGLRTPGLKPGLSLLETSTAKVSKSSILVLSRFLDT